MPGPDTLHNEGQTNKTTTQNISETISEYSHAAKDKISDAGAYVKQSALDIKDTLSEALCDTEEKLANLRIKSKEPETVLQNIPPAEHQDSSLELTSQPGIGQKLTNIKNTAYEKVHEGLQWVEEKGQKLKEWVKDGDVKPDDVITDASLSDRDKAFKQIAKEEYAQSWAEKKGESLKNEVLEQKFKLAEKYKYDLKGERIDDDSTLTFTQRLEQIQKNNEQDEKQMAEDLTYEEHFNFGDKVLQEKQSQQIHSHDEHGSEFTAEESQFYDQLFR